MMRLQAMWQHFSGYKSSNDSFPIDWVSNPPPCNLPSTVLSLSIKVKTHSAER
jgi:hypothetical protein